MARPLNVGDEREERGAPPSEPSGGGGEYATPWGGYAWDPNKGWYWIGSGKRPGPYDQIPDPPSRLWDPQGFKISPAGRPLNLLPCVSSSGVWALSYHVSAAQWIKVTAYMEQQGGYLEVPLLDDDNVPWLDPAIPPAIVGTRQHEVALDRVTAPGTAGVKWSDENCFTRVNSGAQGTSPVVQVGLKPALDPVPHWVLRMLLSNGGSGSQSTNVMVDLFGQFFASHSSSSVEVGSSGTVGHYQVLQMWSDQGFNTTGDRTVLNERLYENGAIDVAHGASQVLYLTTGANEGTASGTRNFGGDTDDVPAVLVYGHADIGSGNLVAGSARTTWKPETWGMGCTVAGATDANVQDSTKLHYSELYWDGAASDWALEVFNVALGTPTSTRDRTFFPFSLGRP